MRSNSCYYFIIIMIFSTGFIYLKLEGTLYEHAKEYQDKFLKYLQYDSRVMKKYSKLPNIGSKCHRSPYITMFLNDKVDYCAKPLIFLMETSKSPTLNPRQACAVESAALHNPSNQVIIFMTSPSINKTDPIMKALNTINNVDFRLLQLNSFFKNSPLESWFHSNTRLESPYQISHLSDALRFLLLWTYGGIYLDLDVVVLRSLQSLYNCSGLEDENFVGAGVMAFDKNHPLIGICLREFSSSYKPHHWGYNGPMLLTRVLKRFCGGISNFVSVTREQCLGVDVLSPEAFYSIPWNKWKLFFLENESVDVSAQWQNSYVIHLWNKLSMNRMITLGANQPYETAVKTNCPHVYNYIQTRGYF